MSDSTRFVGRRQELAALIRRADEAIAGRGGIVLVAGEPGIGKTRLAEELSAVGRDRGARVLWGRCYEGEGAPAFWPWIEILREADAKRADQDARLPEEIRAILFLETHDRPADRPSGAGPSPLDPASRFRVFRAIGGYLRARAARQPVLLVLDDLQWADTSSLLLLQFLARDAGVDSTLLLGMYRDVEVGRDHPLARALVALSRERGYQHLTLRGLSPEDTATLAAGAGQAGADDAFTRSLHRLTGGNPFFIGEIVRHLADTGRSGEPALLAFDYPESARGLIRQRLARLSEAARQVLTIAAVVGSDFDLATIASLPLVRDLPVLEALDEAERARLLTAGSRAEPALRYRFAHDLIRETVYDDLGRAERVRLHRAVGEVLEARWRENLEAHVFELAYHFTQAAPGGDADPALRYARQAGDRALEQSAYDEAARWYGLALAASGQLTPVDQAARCDLLIAQSNALLMAGQARRVVEQIAPEALALAEALGEDGRWRAATISHQALVGLIRHGGPGTLVGSLLYRTWADRVDRYARPDSPERVYADIALADAHSASGSLGETLALYERALALARRLDDPDALYFAAFQLLNWGGGPRRQADRLKLAEEFSTRPRAGVHPRNLGRALWRCGAILLDWGQRSRAEALWQEVSRLASRTHEPELLLYEPIGQAIRATLDGDFDDALRAVSRLIEWSTELGSRAYGHKYAARLRERPLLWARDRVPSPPVDPEVAARDVWAEANAASAALRQAQDGQLEPARHALSLALHRLRMVRGQDASFPWHVVALLELAVALEDRSAARWLADMLAVLAPCATSDWGLTTVARHLGCAAALNGDPSAARWYFEQALAVAGQIRFRPEVALASLELASILAAEPAERGAAVRHLDLAVTELRAMQMRRPLRRALDLQQRMSPADGAPNLAADPEQLTPRELDVLRLLASGRSNREIAIELVVSVRTVEHHIERIYRKIDARRRVDAAAYALRHGLVASDETG